MTENTDGWPPDTEVSARPQSIKAEPNRMSSVLDTQFRAFLSAGAGRAGRVLTVAQRLSLDVDLSGLLAQQ
jgi:hypothetical protein